MTYDPERRAVVLFGGADSAHSDFGDWWEWGGTTWRQILRGRPGPRRNAPMTYVADREVILLHGGSRGGDALADTWELRTQRPLTGDVNCDCALNAFDIEPFLTALFEPDRYAAMYPDCDISLADINADGAVNSFDIEPFITLLFDP